jgi:hypothetical protein
LQKAKAILREALSLPGTQRADIALELIESLEPLPVEDPAAVEVAWRQEIERRARRVQREGAAGEDWETVRERTARKLSEE